MTVAKVRELLGNSGSNTTILTHLSAWKANTAINSGVITQRLLDALKDEVAQLVAAERSQLSRSIKASIKSRETSRAELLALRKMVKDQASELSKGLVSLRQAKENWNNRQQALSLLRDRFGHTSAALDREREIREQLEKDLVTARKRIAALESLIQRSKLPK